jgi:UDP-N-acetyl-D-glucosamine dehydrogenase
MIESKKMTVGVVGLGYVGLPLILGYASKGFPTIGFDVDPKKIDHISRGETYIEHIPRKVSRYERLQQSF